jgi:hypothetical protein
METEMGRVIVKRKKELTLQDGIKLEVMDHFCYLGDVISAGGGPGNASRALEKWWLKVSGLCSSTDIESCITQVKGKGLEHLRQDNGVWK